MKKNNKKLYFMLQQCQIREMNRYHDTETEKRRKTTFGRSTLFAVITLI